MSVKVNTKYQPGIITLFSDFVFRADILYTTCSRDKPSVSVVLCACAHAHQPRNVGSVGSCKHFTIQESKPATKTRIEAWKSATLAGKMAFLNTNHFQVELQHVSFLKNRLKIFPISIYLIVIHLESFYVQLFDLCRPFVNRNSSKSEGHFTTEKIYIQSLIQL